jgi:hypothetical protein
MNFEQWWATKNYRIEHKELIQCGWEAAVANRAAPLLLNRRAHDLRVGDIWIAKVKGGSRESLVQIQRVLLTHVIISDHDGRDHRERRIEDLDFVRRVTQ